MSYVSMMTHRCNLMELIDTVVNGFSTETWAIVTNGSNVRCFLDLNFRRKDKDAPLWTPEAGRSADRAGVLFVDPSAPLAAGQRLLMLHGPSGVFVVGDVIDEAWTPRRLHHLEVSVTEIGRPIAQGAPTA